jgi:hypothetical protein
VAQGLADVALHLENFLQRRFVNFYMFHNLMVTIHGNNRTQQMSCQCQVVILSVFYLDPWASSRHVCQL